MKKMLILVTALMLTLILGSAAMASTMGVNVSPGFSLDIERDHVFSAGENDDWAVRFNAGLSENLLFQLTYTTFDDDSDDNVALRMRYELVDNLALLVDYSNRGDVDSYDLGLRGKAKFSDSAAFVGQLLYKDNNAALSDSYFDFYGQVEFYIGEVAAINFGVGLTDQDDSDPSFCVGAEYYIGKSTLYFDYYIYDDSSSNAICAGVEFGF